MLEMNKDERKCKRGQSESKLAKICKHIQLKSTKQECLNKAFQQ